MNAHEGESIKLVENTDHSDGLADEPGLAAPHEGSPRESRSLAELLGEPEPIPLPQDVQWFATALLREPCRAAQTAPVIAMVAELLDILRDEHTPDQQAHHALRRAVRWLRVFTTEPSRPTTRNSSTTDHHSLAISARDLADAAASRQLATTWLRGTPQAAIRTEPVIGVVAQLHYDLQCSSKGQNAQSRLRHAVRLLEVFVADEEAAPQPR